MEQMEVQAQSKVQEREKVEPIVIDGEEHQPKKTEYNDLCSTCNDKPICTSRKNLVRPVYFCESYDDFMPEKPVEIFAKPTTKPASEDSVLELKGLCVNCDHNNTCAFPKRDGGVWHCEEYE